MSNRTLFGLVLASMAAVWGQRGLAADSWNQFRGPAGTGAIQADSLPISWSPEAHITWRTELPGQGWSSPVLDGLKIYVTCAIDSSPDQDGSAFDMTMVVIDAKSGDEIGRHLVFHQSADDLKKIHAKNSHASPTPVIESGRIYLHFGHQGTACMDLDGNPVWVNRELSFPPVHGNGGSPILVGDLLVFTCDGAHEPYVCALDKRTGKVAWKCPRPVDAKKKFSFCTPTLIEVNQKPQIIAPGSDCVLAIDPADGTIIWQVDYDGYSVVPKPIFAAGILYVCTGFDRGSLLAIDPSGTGNISDSHVLWRIDRGIPKTPSPIYHDGLLYLISDAGVAMCLDAKSGDTVWQERVGGKYSASPVIHGDRIYLTSEEGVTTVIKTGREYQSIASNDLQERTLASFAAVDNSLIIRTEKAIYRISE